MPAPLITPTSRRPPQEEVRPGFPHERIMIFGLIQLLSGVASIILATVAIAVMAWGYFIGSGIWCGAFFIVSGIIGILSSKKKDNCMIISFMVMSILTAIISGIQVGIASSGIVIDLHFNRTEILVVDLQEDIESYHESLVQVIVVHCLILLIAVIDGVCAIVSSALCCRTVCCGVLLPLGLEERFMPPGTRVQYLPGTIQAEDQHGNIQQFAFISPTSPHRDGDIYTFNSGAIMIQPPGMMPQFCMIPPPPGLGQYISGPPPPYSSREELEQSLPPSYPGTPLQRIAVRAVSAPSSAHSTLSRADESVSVSSNQTTTTIHIVRPIWRPAFRPSTSSPRSSISRNNHFTAVLETEENVINNIRSSELSFSMNSSIDHSSSHETDPMISPQPPHETGAENDVKAESSTTLTLQTDTNPPDPTPSNPPDPTPSNPPNPPDATVLPSNPPDPTDSSNPPNPSHDH